MRLCSGDSNEQAKWRPTGTGDEYLFRRGNQGSMRLNKHRNMLFMVTWLFSSVAGTESQFFDSRTLALSITVSLQQNSREVKEAPP